jgi:DNA-binding PadR family transcriptional regulator
MSILIANEQMDFAGLKSLLLLTDGNMASHLTALEKLQFIQVSKQFVGKKPNTTYTVTQSGRQAFVAHLTALENIIQQNQANQQ